MEEKLSQFVDHARAQGMDCATIRWLLVSAGWREPQIAEVICARALELPIPQAPQLRERPGGKTDVSWPRRAAEVFLQLLAFSALFATTTSLILLSFACIDLTFPDPAWRLSTSGLHELLSAMRAQMAALIVSFPLFLGVWHALLRRERAAPGKTSSIRRWLVYAFLLVGIATLAGDAVTLIYFLLEGQMTLRLLLKSGCLFGIAGGLVFYLATTLRGLLMPGTHRVFTAVSSLVVLAAFAGGVAMVGSPQTTRLQRLDRRRLEDLQTIVRELQSLCQDPDNQDALKRALPETLEELATLARSSRIRLHDPETGQPYAYAVMSGTTYQLGTSFALPRDADQDVFWNHAAGPQSFTIDALDPP